MVCGLVDVVVLLVVLFVSGVIQWVKLLVKFGVSLMFMLFYVWVVSVLLWCIVSGLSVVLMNFVIELFGLNICVILLVLVLIFVFVVNGYLVVSEFWNGWQICVFYILLILVLVGWIMIVNVCISGCISSGCSDLCCELVRFVSICLLMSFSELVSFELLLLSVCCISWCVFGFGLFWFLIMLKCVWIFDSDFMQFFSIDVLLCVVMICVSLMNFWLIGFIGILVGLLLMLMLVVVIWLVCECENSCLIQFMMFVCVFLIVMFVSDGLFYDVWLYVVLRILWIGEFCGLLRWFILLMVWLKLVKFCIVMFCMNFCQCCVYLVLYMLMSVFWICLGLFLSVRLFCVDVLSIQFFVCSFLVVVLWIVGCMQLNYVLCVNVFGIVQLFVMSFWLLLLMMCVMVIGVKWVDVWVLIFLQMCWWVGMLCIMWCRFLWVWLMSVRFVLIIGQLLLFMWDRQNEIICLVFWIILLCGMLL